MLGTALYGQETERAGLAVEFPELGTGKITSVKSYITRSDVTAINFWILSPIADKIEWGTVAVRVNGTSANRLCNQLAGGQHKVMKCDLNRLFGFKLNPKDNNLEIETVDTSGKRYYAGFNVLVNAAMARAQILQANAEQPKAQNPTLGFSGRKFAVILGVSKYKYNDAGLGNLTYADADADALYKWLTTKGGFSPQNVLYFTNEKVTLSGVRDTLVRFLTKAAETDLILFYFAGHGTPDPSDPSNLYYLVHDSKVTNLKKTGFPMIELKKIIDENLRSRRAIFLLDTCHSAGLSGKKVVGFSKPTDGTRDLSADAFDERQLQQVDVKNDVSTSAGRLFSSTGRAILTSSDVGEPSRESKRWGGGHGVFTWAIIEGLDGRADRNNDRIVTAEELFSFVQDFVKTETNSKQNPRLFSSLGGTLELAVIK
ncbi:MAG: caspase domain-containing protein [Pyrinomonadaceae bacterium]